MKKIYRKDILSKLKAEGRDKKKVTLYLSESLYKSFQRACEGEAASKVIEELMKSFVYS